MSQQKPPCTPQQDKDMSQDITLLKKSAFARGLVLVPVVVGVLDILVVVEHVEQLFHVLDVLVALELDVGLRDEADVRADEGIVLLLEALTTSLNASGSVVISKTLSSALKSSAPASSASIMTASSS